MQVEPHRLDSAGALRSGPSAEVVVNIEEHDLVEQRLDQLGEIAAKTVSRDVRVADIEAHPDLLASHPANQLAHDPRIVRRALLSRIPRSGVLDGDADARVARPARQTTERALGSIDAPTVEHEHLGPGDLGVTQRAPQERVVTPGADDQVARGMEDEAHPGEPEVGSQRCRVRLEQAVVKEQLAARRS